MKNFKGKAIYNPSGKAGEYSYWACNFYVGCSNGCTYCYCKKGILAGAMGQDKPQLKKCFKDEEFAYAQFAKELIQNKEELQKNGLFFSFTTDPMLPETIGLTQRAIRFCLINNVPVKVLTKCTDWVNPMLNELVKNDTLWNLDWSYKKLLAIGFTLTGHDELEPQASTNAERIQAMKSLNAEGIMTWASIEPIINFHDSLEMIKLSNFYCDLFKIGLESGKKYYSLALRDWIEDVLMWTELSTKIYFKDTLLKAAHYDRADLPSNCVNRDYNMFNPNTKAK